MAGGDGQTDHRAHREHGPHGIVAALGRVLLVFFTVTLWCFALAIAYAYGGQHGLLGWLRLPEGLAPFRRLELGIAEIGTLAALFVAILLASTVQLNSTVTAADDIATGRPTTADGARHQQHRLRFHANQAEMSLIGSFGSAFAVLMLTTLLGLADMADLAEAEGIDVHGVGWAGFLAAAEALGQPRFLIMYLVSFLLFLTTYSSLPEWKNTGLFQRRVEDNAWDSVERLTLLARYHRLDSIEPVRHPRLARAAAVTGYVLYVSVFALVLNVSLSILVGGERFAGIFTAGHGYYFLLFTLLGTVISAAVGIIMLRLHHLHGQNNLLLLVSLVLGVVALLYIILGEGAVWLLAVGVVVVLHTAWWMLLYLRGMAALDEKQPASREFLLNPPKFIITRRFEAIRRSAALLER